jgi:hypothetical protein
MCIAMKVRNSGTDLIKRRFPGEHLETWFAETLSGLLAPAALCIDLEAMSRI